MRPLSPPVSTTLHPGTSPRGLARLALVLGALALGAATGCDDESCDDNPLCGDRAALEPGAAGGQGPGAPGTALCEDACNRVYDECGETFPGDRGQALKPEHCVQNCLAGGLTQNQALCIVGSVCGGIARDCLELPTKPGLDTGRHDGRDPE